MLSHRERNKKQREKMRKRERERERKAKRRRDSPHSEFKVGERKSRKKDKIR